MGKSKEGTRQIITNKWNYVFTEEFVMGVCEF